jgi:hypothetical protein
MNKRTALSLLFILFFGFLSLKAFGDASQFQSPTIKLKTEDGRNFISRDLGKSWKEITYSTQKVILYEKGNFFYSENLGKSWIKISESKEKNKLRVTVFPQPAKAMLNIILDSPEEILRIDIYNIQGVCVNTFEYHNTTSEINIDLKNIKAGMYIANIFINDAFVLKSFIVN